MSKIRSDLRVRARGITTITSNSSYTSDSYFANKSDVILDIGPGLESYLVLKFVVLIKCQYYTYKRKEGFILLSNVLL